MIFASRYFIFFELLCPPRHEPTFCLLICFYDHQHEEHQGSRFEGYPDNTGVCRHSNLYSKGMHVGLLSPGVSQLRKL